MPAQLATWNPARGVWERDQSSMCGHLAPYLETWPVSGMTHAGKAFELAISARHTSAFGSSLLPTPKATNNENRSSDGYPDNLGQTIKKRLPTPLAQEASQRRKSKTWIGTPGLTEVIMDQLPE